MIEVVDNRGVELIEELSELTPEELIDLRGEALNRIFDAEAVLATIDEALDKMDAHPDASHWSRF